MDIFFWVFHVKCKLFTSTNASIWLVCTVEANILHLHSFSTMKCVFPTQPWINTMECVLPTQPWVNTMECVLPRQVFFPYHYGLTPSIKGRFLPFTVSFDSGLQQTSICRRIIPFLATLSNFLYHFFTISSSAEMFTFWIPQC